MESRKYIKKIEKFIKEVDIQNEYLESKVVEYGLEDIYVNEIDDSTFIDVVESLSTLIMITQTQISLLEKENES